MASSSVVRNQPTVHTSPYPSPARRLSPSPELAPQPPRRVTRSRVQAQTGPAGRVDSHQDAPVRKRQVPTRPGARVMDDSQDATSVGVGVSLGKRKRGPVGQAAPGEQSGAGQVPDKGKKRTRASGRIAESERGVREVGGRKATGAGKGKKSGLGGRQVRRSTRRIRGVVVKEETQEEEVVAESSVVGRKRTRSGGVKRRGQAAEEVVEGEPEEPVGRKRTKTGGAKRSVQKTRVKVEEVEVESTTQPKDVPREVGGRKKSKPAGKASKRSKPAGESSRRKQRSAPTAPGEASGSRPTRRTAKGGESKVKEEDAEPASQSVPARKRRKPAGESSRCKQRSAPTAPGEASGSRPTRRTAKGGESTKVKEEDPEPASKLVPASSTHHLPTRPRRRVRKPEAAAAVVAAPVVPAEHQRHGARRPRRTTRKSGKS